MQQQQQQQQQQPPPMLVPPFQNVNITTEQIQKYLDENKQLILAILDNQNLGKLAECAQFQAKLQNNLMYLAAIADAQPQAPTVPSQMPPQAAIQQAGHYMQQHPQMGTAQPSSFTQKIPMQFSPQQMQEQQQHQLRHQHMQSIQGHMGIRPGATNGVHAMHSENRGGSGGSPSASGFAEFARAGAGASSGSIDARGSKQDAGATMETTGDAHGSSGASAGTVNAQPSYLKGSEEGAKKT